jgi:bisphosphoglycerate-independent phosphoglycerate mutase (AlkP superfamily)
MHILFLFLDGVGLGENNPAINPWAHASMPHLIELLEGNRLVNSPSLPLETRGATLLAVDAGMGVRGLPQSATGQATLLTGRNIPAEIGYHYGPKPNPEVASFLQTNTIFHHMQAARKSAALLSAYPPRYFEAIESGKRLYSAIPLSANNAGIPLFGVNEVMNKTAIPADFTGQAWNRQAGFPKIPEHSPVEAGRLLATLGKRYNFSLFEYWLSDYAGHGQDMDEAVKLLEVLDAVLGGLLEVWDASNGLILLTSDHGNLEDLGTRHHTAFPVPVLLIGSPELRRQFLEDQSSFYDLSGIAPRIIKFIG